MLKILFFLFATLFHFLWLRWFLRLFPALRPYGRRLFAAAVVLSALSPIFRTLPWTGVLKGKVLSLSAIELMVVTLSGALLLLWTAIFGILRMVRPRLPGQTLARPPEPIPSQAEVDLLSRRETLERVGGLSLLATSSAILGWGTVRGRHAFEISEVVVPIAGLPRALDGYTLAQVSDLHVGTFVGEQELAEGFSLIKKIKPDLIVATGDLVDYDPRFIPIMLRALRSLESRDGTAVILGNHDYYTGADEVAAGARAAGLHLLINEALHVRAGDGGGFALLGVDDYAGRRLGRGPRLDRAMAHSMHLPRILLAHQPQFFDETGGGVALQLSGHVHGGQINPGFCVAKLMLKYVEGRYEKDGSTLWVNRGFGTAGPPSRICAPPEVTKIVLVAA